MHSNFLVKTIIIFSLFCFNGIESKVLIFDLSQKNVEISKKSNQPDFIIFGYKDSTEPLVIKIKGPEQKVILQKKTKVINF